jgi:magnesium chelatase subunit I
MENVVSNAERRALARGERAAPRVSDVYASLPAITGKIELEYEGELKGAEVVSRDLVRRAVGETFQKYASASDFATVVEWFDEGGFLRIPDSASADEALEVLEDVPGLATRTSLVNVDEKSPAEERVAACEFILEGLASLRKISRGEERGYHRSEERQRTEMGFEEVMDGTKTHLN